MNRFYAPDFSATAQILTDVAEALANSGYSVEVFTSRMNYDGTESYYKKERLNGVGIHRVWSTRFGRTSTFGRSLDYLTFYLSVTIQLLFCVSRDQIIVAKTDPPALSIPVGGVARIRRLKIINWLQDIFPEVALELGLGKSEGFFVGFLKRIRNRSLARARMNVAIGQRMAESISKFEIPQDRIRVIGNFVDDESIKRSENYSPALRRNWDIAETDFIVGYSGNLGRAHDLDTILDAAQLLNSSPEIKFLFIGGGHRHQTLTREIASRQLTNILIRPYQPRDRLNESLALPNIHWATLDPKMEGYIVPSKIYGVAAAGRPLLMIGDRDGEVGHILSQHKFGACIPIGEPERVVKFILQLQSDIELNRNMGILARRFIDNHASRQKSIAEWDRLLTYLSSTA